MDAVQAKLAELTAIVEGARSMPMSASCVVNRAEVLDLLGELQALLPKQLHEAQAVLGDRHEVVQAGHREAEQIIAEARVERERLLVETDVYAEGQLEAARLVHEARILTDSMRLEVEDYVDGKLANFEIVLTKTLAAVERGRQKLAGRSELDELRDAEEHNSFIDQPQPG